MNLIRIGREPNPSLKVEEMWKSLSVSEIGYNVILIILDDEASDVGNYFNNEGDADAIEFELKLNG